ncbi:MAG: PEP-utilizing enzyme [Chloroflexi bacterium]|nr:PEP-utilizing enzyme [Chloroflexota bacterium]
MRTDASAPAPLLALRTRGRPTDRSRVGAKAASLAWLASRGVPVPAAVVVPVEVAAQVAAGDARATDLLAAALDSWLDPARTYAVRSSADGQDGDLRSFAGQLETRLAVPAAGVVEAVRAVARPDAKRLAAYAARAGAPVPVRIGVIVQEMVEARGAGIAFSRNPLTGLDEVVVEALPSRGDALALEGATPDRWIRRWGAFTEEPASPRVPASVAEAVARETARLARAYGQPVDLEWAHDGTTTWWLQARPITGLDGVHVYSNRMARDMLPGVITPLVWSVNVPIVNSAWIGLLEEVVGPLDLRPEDLARSFGYHAYFDMTTLGSVLETIGMPRDSIELLLGLPKGPEAPRFRGSRSTLRHLPRVVATARRTLRRGRWARVEVREMQARYEELAAIDPTSLDEHALLARIDAIGVLARRAAYANIVIPMVMLAYDRALGSQLRGAGVDPASVDPAAARADREGWEPNPALDRLRALAGALPDEARADLAARRAQALEERTELAALRAALDAFIAQFGHLSETSNDFSKPSWREDRDAVVGLVLAHRAKVAAVEPACLEALEARVPPVRRPALRLLWRRSGAFRVYREAVGATWARSYGLFRGTFLALGARLVERGVLDQPDDVFFLALDEIRVLAAAADPGAGPPAGPLDGEARGLVARRRVEVAEAAEMVVPEVVYGDTFVPHRRGEQARARLTGIPTSRGVVRGPARVVRGSADFSRVAPGDVIVIPFSDVAWTPLFARAAGVVAESGGILSHSTIVAREYGIPCVVSVSDACSEIPDGALIVVDGTAGSVVVVHDGRADAGAGAELHAGDVT